MGNQMCCQGDDRDKEKGNFDLQSKLLYLKLIIILYKR